jgi:hypothetical protein
MFDEAAAGDVRFASRDRRSMRRPALYEVAAREVRFCGRRRMRKLPAENAASFWL